MKAGDETLFDPNKHHVSWITKDLNFASVVGCLNDLSDYASTN